MVDTFYPIDRNFFDRDQYVGTFFLCLEHPETVSVDKFAIERFEFVLYLMVDDDGLIDYVFLLVAVRLGCC